jgi:hypothetical protein
VEAPSALYREKIKLGRGDHVRVSYNPRKPQKVAVHGYDFRLREPLGSIAGLLLSVAAAVIAIHL